METGTRSTGLYYSLRNSGLLAACLYGVGQGHAIQLPPKQRLSLDSTSFFFVFLPRGSDSKVSKSRNFCHAERLDR